MLIQIQFAVCDMQFEAVNAKAVGQKPVNGIWKLDSLFCPGPHKRTHPEHLPRLA